MHHPRWPQGPRPSIDEPLATHSWLLSSPMELTRLRMRLRDYIFPADPRGEIRNDEQDRLLLAVEELASNSLRHGRPPVSATLTIAADGWLIDVTDGATDHAPTPALDREPSRGGLGLPLIAELCTAHGWYTEAACKHVWAFLARTPAQLPDQEG